LFTQLPDLSVLQSRFLRWAMNTAVLHAPDGGAVLIDPGILPDEIAALRSCAGLRSHAGTGPLHALFLTHSHYDHMIGATAFASVPVIASDQQERLRERVLYVMATRLEPDARDHGIAWDPAPAFVAATQHIGRRGPIHPALPDWEAIPVPGHSHDLLALYNATTGVLWASDAVTDANSIPTLWHGESAEYIASLRTLAALDVRTLVPGHGRIAMTPADAREYLQANLGYLEGLRACIERATAAGLDQAAAVAACADCVPYPPRWAALHRMNSERIWAELAR
jgi:glyoxylase-like metal-dependent hydrolase (beta-lactamase superfamily II)